MERRWKLPKRWHHWSQKTTWQGKRTKRTGRGNMVVRKMRMREMELKWPKKKRRQVCLILKDFTQLDDGCCSPILFIYSFRNSIYHLICLNYFYSLYYVLYQVVQSFLNIYNCIIFFQWTKLQRSHRRMKSIKQFRKVFVFQVAQFTWLSTAILNYFIYMNCWMWL